MKNKSLLSLLILLVIAGVMIWAGFSFLSAKSHRPKTARPSSFSQENAPKQKKKVAEKVPLQSRGFIIPGLPNAFAQTIDADDQVDVLMTFEAQLKNGRKENVTVTLLQNIKVLDVGLEQPQRAGLTGPVGGNAYVVLALSPKDSQYLSVALTQGKLDLVLRQPGDEETDVMEIASLEKLFRE